MAKAKKNPKRVKAGRAGGKKTVAKLGKGHMRAIGEKGGKRTQDLVVKGRAFELKTRREKRKAKSKKKGK